MDYQYNIGCSLTNLKGIRDFIRESLREQDITEIAASEIVLALDEMCSNLMIHAHQCNPSHILELHIKVLKEHTFVFEIVDERNVFDINQFAEPALGSLVNEKRKGGLGIRLVKSIMDNIEYIHEGKKTTCRLTKVIS
jgi:serine/threonine-protein kinase RsbW